MAEYEVIIYCYCAHFTSTILTPFFSMWNNREKKYHPQEVVHQQNL